MERDYFGIRILLSVLFDIGQGGRIISALTDNKKHRPKSKAVLFFFKFDYIGNLAVKGVAKSIKSFGVYAFALFDSVQGVCGKTLFEYKVVFRYAFSVKRFIKRFVAYHFSSPF